MTPQLPDQRDAFMRLDQLFAHALSLGSGAEAWLDSLRGEDAQMVHTVRALMAASCEEESAFDTISTTRHDFLQSLLKRRAKPLSKGERVGVFIIEDLLGQGGFSNVYKAKRDTGLFDQTVALKVFHTPLVTDFDSQRFADECSALAKIDHPNIARIIDGGSDERGRAWIAMELVDGTPVTRALASAPRAARLDAILQVAAAISEAHRRSILHLDIKPANILLDAEGRVRLLDFGLAQLLGPLAQGSVSPDNAQALTPAYAAPEQVRRDALSIATDIFMLGGLLQEVLTGHRPNLAEKGDLESLPRPLVQIISHCRQEEPMDRYRSADRLISDLERYCERLPISLSTSPGRDLVVAVVQRNPWATVLGGLAALMLIGWAATSSHLSALYEEERDRAVAQQATAEATTQAVLSVFRRADPLELDTALEPDANAWQYLAAAADDLRGTLQDEPAALIEVLALAEALHTRADQLEQAAALREEIANRTVEHYGADSVEAAMARVAWLGPEAQSRGEIGLGQLVELEGTLAPLESEAPSDIAQGYLLLAYAWNDIGDAEEAGRLAARTVELLPADGTTNLNTAIEARLLLGRIANAAGRPRDAIVQLTETIDITERAYGSEHARIVGPLSGLAAAQRALGNYTDAIDHQVRAIAIQSRFDEPGSETLLRLRNNLALTYRSAGMLGLAEVEQRTLLELEIGRSGGTGTGLATRYQNLATTLEAQGALSDAREAYTAAAQLFSDTLAEQNVTRWLPYISLARVQLKMGDEANAQAAAEIARGGLQPLLPADHFALDVLTCLEGAIAMRGPAPLDQARLEAAEERLRSRPRRDEERSFCLAALGQP